MDRGAIKLVARDVDEMPLTILSRTEAFHRWALNFADRAKVLLSFHVATQDISKVNHPDSTSMNTIAIVTLVFRRLRAPMFFNIRPTFGSSLQLPSPLRWQSLHHGGCGREGGAEWNGLTLIVSASGLLCGRSSNPLGRTRI
jgi:hypothetical protein